jgi:hypothetical protein
MVPQFPHFGSASMLAVLATICNSDFEVVSFEGNKKILFFRGVLEMADFTHM